MYLDSYYIDETPVTNEQYSQFLEKSGHPKPPHFSSGKNDPNWAKRPVTYVTWDDASAYAKWAHRRLPTEAEWEKAARGIDGRTWPWGDASPDENETSLAHYGDEDASPMQVGQFPNGISPLGALDMAGNVWEWCSDQYDQNFYPRSNPRNPVCTDGDPRYRVARGGACTYSAFVMRTTFRGWNLPNIQSHCYGFRCAADSVRYRKNK